MKPIPFARMSTLVAVVALLLATSLPACNRSPPSGPQREISAVLIPTWAVKVRPKPGAISRAEYEENVLAEPHKVDPAAFAANLSKALNAVDRFVNASGDFKTYVTDWDVRKSDVVGLMWMTIDRMTASTETKPEFLLAEDMMGYPRYYAVWRGPERYRAAQLNDNNDNDSLMWTVASGRFALPDAYSLKETLSREQFLARIDTTFGKDKTVYPHIELYSVCLPECD